MDNFRFIIGHLNFYRKLEIKKIISEGIFEFIFFFLSFVLLFLLFISLFPAHTFVISFRFILFFLFIFFIFRIFFNINYFLKIPFEKLAIIYEKKFPEINNHLINSVDIVKKTSIYPLEFIERLKQKTVEIIKGIDVKKAIEKEKNTFYSKLILSLLFIMFFLFKFYPESITNGFNTLFFNYKFKIEPGNCEVIRGMPLKIKFYTEKRYIADIEIKSEIENKKFPMNYENFFYSHFIEKVQIPFSYRIISENIITPWYKVDVREETNIKKILLFLKFPSYTGLKNEKKQIGFESFEVLNNTEVQMDLIFNNRVGETYLILSNGEILKSTEISDKKRFKFYVNQPLLFRVKFYDIFKKTFISAPDKKIEIKYDNSPFVEILEPRKDLVKNSKEKFKIKVLLEDDFGIKEVRFKTNFLKNEVGKDDFVFYFQRFLGNEKRKIIEVYLNLPDKFEKPVYYYVECLDNYLPSGNLGISSVYYVYPYENVKNKKEFEKFLSKVEEKENLQKDLKEIKGNINEFIEKENHLIKAMKKIGDIKDLSDKNEIDKIVEAQNKYLDAIQKILDDLNKIAKQTEGKFTLSDEFIEMVSHIQKSIENLKKQTISMAVSEAEIGLELAKEITSNLERWLAENQDNIRWNLEEPSKKYEIPEAELPSELEDIIGELIEKEEDMKEEIEDITSSWMDSLDKGAGWGVSDGPISNMSAKGITGNIMPNQTEIGGRSGEGRTGRSYGEMVEKTATGKGGRKTPARLTPDNLEPGVIDDRSKENQLGPTGGGKLSGWGPMGLTGDVKDVQYKYDLLMRQQKEIIDKAEKLLLNLKAVNIYNPQLENIISKMRTFEIQFKEGKYNELLKTKAEIVQDLKQVRQTFTKQSILRTEKLKIGKGNVKFGESIIEERIPEGYEKIITKYFNLNLK